jgi:hypothetical protein
MLKSIEAGADHNLGALGEGVAEDDIAEDHEVVEALGALEPAWDELYPAADDQAVD